MRITGPISKITGVYDKQNILGRTERVSGVASKKDMISISGGGRDFQVVQKALKDVPDIRVDRVNELTAKYDAGNYDVNGNDIADKIIHSIVDWKA